MPTPTKKPRPFPAKFAGTCVKCEDDIVKGEQIAKTPAGYAHTECETNPEADAERAYFDTWADINDIRFGTED